MYKDFTETVIEKGDSNTSIKEMGPVALYKFHLLEKNDISESPSTKTSILKNVGEMGNLFKLTEPEDLEHLEMGIKEKIAEYTLRDDNVLQEQADDSTEKSVKSHLTDDIQHDVKGMEENGEYFEEDVNAKDSCRSSKNEEGIEGTCTSKQKDEVSEIEQKEILVIEESKVRSERHIAEQEKERLKIEGKNGTNNCTLDEIQNSELEGKCELQISEQDEEEMEISEQLQDVESQLVDYAMPRGELIDSVKKREFERQYLEVENQSIDRGEHLSIQSTSRLESNFSSSIYNESISLLTCICSGTSNRKL